MMYKMAWKTFPQLAGASPSTLNSVSLSDIPIPSAMMSNYHDQTPAPQIQKKPATFTVDEIPPSPTAMSRTTTDTQELANFLKRSNPEDYRISPTKTESFEDLSTSNPSHRKGLRFLRAALSKDSKENVISRIQSPPPIQSPHVVSRTTARGKPYLQIQVDYGPKIAREGSTDTSSAPTISEAPTPVQPAAATVEIADANSMNMESPATAVPRAQPETEGFAVESVDPYQEFYHPYSHSSQNRLKPGPTLSLRTSPANAGEKQKRSYGATLQAPNTTFRPLHSPVDRPKTPDRSSVISVDLASYYSSPIQTQPPILQLNPSYHQRSKSQENSLRSSSARSDGTNDDTSVDGFSDMPVKHSIHVQPQLSQIYPQQSRKLPKLGPPPNRVLPSLPEVNDDKATANRVHKEASSRSDSPVPISPIEDGELLSRKNRQERVRARKARDMGEMHKTHVTHDKKLQEAIRLLDNDIELRERQSQAPGSSSSSTATSTTSSGRRQSGRQTRRGSADKSIKSIPSPTKITAADFPVPSSPSPREITRANESKGRSDPSIVTAATASSSRKNSYTPTAKEVELETRILALERRNWVLEQALMTILQRAMSRRDPNGSIPRGRDTLESLLAELNMEIPIQF